MRSCSRQTRRGEEEDALTGGPDASAGRRRGAACGAGPAALLGHSEKGDAGRRPKRVERGEGRPVGPAARERERGGSWARNERGRKRAVIFFLFLKHISKANSKCKFKSI